MRIIAGELKGRKIVEPQNRGLTHPMGERERLALFNSLSGLIEDWGAQAVLDAYAGTGALGFEALSRGAGSVVLVDNDKRATAAMSESLMNLTEVAQAKCQIWRRSVGVLGEDARTAETGGWSLILADPPYDKFAGQKVALVGLVGLLLPGGILVLSHPESADFTEVAAEFAQCGLRLLDTKNYAAARISIFVKD